MSDFILQEGDVGVDSYGFLHGPIRSRADRGFYAAGRAWEPDGTPMTDETRALVAKWESPLPPPRHAADEVIVMRRDRAVAIENNAELGALLTWVKGYCAGDRDRVNHPPGIGALADLVFCLTDELKRKEP